MGLLSRLKKLIEECVEEPCVLLKYTTNTAEKHHPHRPDEAPVGTDGGKEAERGEKELLEVACSPLSSLLNTTWLRRRRSTRLRPEHIGHLPITSTVLVNG